MEIGKCNSWKEIFLAKERLVMLFIFNLRYRRKCSIEGRHIRLSSVELREIHVWGSFK
jgi:hypothetical protein